MIKDSDEDAEGQQQPQAHQAVQLEQEQQQQCAASPPTLSARELRHPCFAHLGAAALSAAVCIERAWQARMSSCCCCCYCHASGGSECGACICGGSAAAAAATAPPPASAACLPPQVYALASAGVAAVVHGAGADTLFAHRDTPLLLLPPGTRPGAGVLEQAQALGSSAAVGVGAGVSSSIGSSSSSSFPGGVSLLSSDRAWLRLALLEGLVWDSEAGVGGVGNRGVGGRGGGEGGGGGSGCAADLVRAHAWSASLLQPDVHDSSASQQPQQPQQQQQRPSDAPPPPPGSRPTHPSSANRTRAREAAADADAAAAAVLSCLATARAREITGDASGAVDAGRRAVWNATGTGADSWQAGGWRTQAWGGYLRTLLLCLRPLVGSIGGGGGGGGSSSSSDAEVIDAVRSMLRAAAASPVASLAAAAAAADANADENCGADVENGEAAAAASGGGGSRDTRGGAGRDDGSDVGAVLLPGPLPDLSAVCELLMSLLPAMHDSLVVSVCEAASAVCGDSPACAQLLAAAAARRDGLCSSASSASSSFPSSSSPSAPPPPQQPSSGWSSWSLPLTASTLLRCHPPAPAATWARVVDACTCGGGSSLAGEELCAAGLSSAHPHSALLWASHVRAAAADGSAAAFAAADECERHGLARPQGLPAATEAAAAAKRVSHAAAAVAVRLAKARNSGAAKAVKEEA
ncbi:hypothetical protein FOA52_004704 [Chlamydomonas sp. UWO 241]|nr:hypothetical protein FOA52_004704 [Chlamydomonas sp. UWO 241]